MNNLKQYAGLLNDEAPEDHFLAYITPGERDMLVEAGGVKTPTSSGIFAYPPDNDARGQSTGSSSSSSNSGGNDNSNDYTGADYGFVASQPTTTTTTTPSNDNSNFDYETQAYNVTNPNFDYETDANSIDAGLGLGEITNATYNKDTGTVDIEQTSGIINTEQYQTANLGAYLDSPDVSDKDKINTLNQLQGLSNSDLKGSKLSNIETDFVLENLDLSFNNIKDQTKYSKYTSSIDENSTTFMGDLTENPLGTVANSGGIIGTIFRGSTDYFKNNKALETLGYTGKTIKYNPDGSGDFNYGGGFLTGNASQGERDAVNQLTPFAADAIGGTTSQPSMVNQYFANMGSNLGVSSAYMNTYNAAKDKISQSLNTQPNNQQYGYGNTFNDNYSRSMTSANPFFDELTNQGLI
jgi:hypothetical protein